MNMVDSGAVDTSSGSGPAALVIGVAGDIIIPLGGHNTVAIDMLLTLIRSLASR